jgi:hypothetical protein
MAQYIFQIAKPCRRCGGYAPAHFLTCPMLRLRPGFDIFEDEDPDELE